MKRILPKAWSTDPFFRQIDELEGLAMRRDAEGESSEGRLLDDLKSPAVCGGIPVINIHLWFDRKTLCSTWSASRVWEADSGSSARGCLS